MDCQVCSEEIPGDSLFCPECGARQDPSKSGAMGGRNFGVVSSQAVQATHDMQETDAAGGSAEGANSADFLNQIAGQMTGDSTQQPTPSGDPSSLTDQVVDQIVESAPATLTISLKLPPIRSFKYSGPSSSISIKAKATIWGKWEISAISLSCSSGFCS